MVMHSTLTRCGLRIAAIYHTTNLLSYFRLATCGIENLPSLLKTNGDVFRSDGTRPGQFAYAHRVSCEGIY